MEQLLYYHIKMTCPTGYSKYEFLCVKNCPQGWHDNGISCTKPKSTPRTNVGPQTSCGNDAIKLGNNCYANCPGGFEQFPPGSSTCRAKCPDGWTDNGASGSCEIANPKSYGRGGGHVSNDLCKSSWNVPNCEECIGLWYPPCATGFSNSGCNLCLRGCPNVTFPSNSIGGKNWIKTEDGKACYRAYFTRRAFPPTLCPANSSTIPSMTGCFTDCPTGFTGTSTTTCTATCPSGFTDGGDVCIKDVQNIPIDGKTFTLSIYVIIIGVIVFIIVIALAIYFGT